MDKLKELLESVREGIAGVELSNPLVGIAAALVVILVTMFLLHDLRAHPTSVGLDRTVAGVAHPCFQRAEAGNSLRRRDCEAARYHH